MAKIVKIIKLHREKKRKSNKKKNKIIIIIIINIIIALIMEKNKWKTKKSIKTLIKVHIKNIIYDKIKIKIISWKKLFHLKIKKKLSTLHFPKETIFIRFVGSKFKYNIYICKL